MMLRIVLLLQTLIVICSACKCKVYPWKETYEEAKFISHVKINKATKTRDQQNLVYDVHHIDIFKKDGELNDKLVTLASSSGCGVPDLKIGQEYLVAGTFANSRELRLVSCLMFVQKNYNGPMGALIWEDTSPELITRLKAESFN